MLRKGNYVLETITHAGEEFFLVKHLKNRARHTHIPISYGHNAARMVLIRADRGKIPESYPSWMVVSINRLWFGQDYELRTDIDNTNLYTNEADLRICHRIKSLAKKGKRVKGCKGYYDHHALSACKD